MTGQLSLFEWHNAEDLPLKSGIYTVKDRKGRVFDTWYERGGFNHVFKGVGYTILKWKHKEADL